MANKIHAFVRLSVQCNQPLFLFLKDKTMYDIPGIDKVEFKKKKYSKEWKWGFPSGVDDFALALCPCFISNYAAYELLI